MRGQNIKKKKEEFTITFQRLPNGQYTWAEEAAQASAAAKQQADNKKAQR